MLLGLQKTSLVDYPGIVAAVFFCAGCNLRCPYCHNSSLVLPNKIERTQLISLEDALQFAEQRQGFLKGIVISGGEPLINDNIPEIIDKLHSFGYKVKVDTNGFFPDKIENLNADYIAMDIKTSINKYVLLQNNLSQAQYQNKLISSINLIRSKMSQNVNTKNYEFRITLAPRIFSESDAYSILDLLEKDDPVYLQRCNTEHVLNPAWAATTIPYTEEQIHKILSIIKTKVPNTKLRGRD